MSTPDALDEAMETRRRQMTAAERDEFNANVRRIVDAASKVFRETLDREIEVRSKAPVQTTPPRNAS